MKFRSTLLLGLALIIGAGGYYFIDYKPGEEKEVEEFLAKKFIPFEPDSVASIELRRGDDLITVFDTPVGWYIKDPVITKADEPIVKNILLRVPDIDKIRKVGEGTGNYDKFGLSDPIVSLKVIMNDGSAIGFDIGDESPTAQFYFASRIENEEIYTVPKPLYNHVNKKLHELRVKNFLNLKNLDAYKVIVKTKNIRYVFDRYTRGFRMTEPAILILETEKVNSLLSRLSNAKSSKFIDFDQPSSEVTGLDDEETSIRIFATNPQRQELLLLGKGYNEDGKAYRYTRNGSRPAIMRMDSILAVTFEEDPFELIKKEVLLFDKDSIDAIDLNHGDIKLSISKQDDGWSVADPEINSADGMKVIEFMEDILALKITGIEEYQPENINKYGFGNPDLLLVLWKNGVEELSIKVGMFKGDESYLQSSKLDPIFRINKSELELLKLTDDDFRKVELNISSE